LAAIDALLLERAAALDRLLLAAAPAAENWCRYVVLTLRKE
jgi:hypothetical protein